jgi:DNA uptake protein ComE-like DNA-binding protein
MRAPELAALKVLLQLNEAPSEALESIPGVGPVLAARICEQRPFRAVSEVLAVRGVGVRKREAIAARACVDCAPPRILRF